MLDKTAKRILFAMLALYVGACWAATDPWVYTLTSRQIFFTLIPVCGLAGYIAYWWADRKLKDEYIFGSVGPNSAHGRMHKQTKQIEMQMVSTGDWIPVSNYFANTFFPYGDDE